MKRYCDACNLEIIWDNKLNEYACYNCGYIGYDWHWK